MRRPIKPNELVKLTVADTTAAWQMQSKSMDHRHPAYPYVFHAQYNSNVNKYLPRALEIVSRLVGTSGNDGENSPAKDVSETMLLAILDYDTEDVANAARASFLQSRHGYELDKALALTTAELGLDRRTAKAANGVAEAVRRLIRFFRMWLTTCRGAN